MTLNNFKVAALATNGFEQAEFTQPRNALVAAGATVHLISPQAGTIKAWDGDDWGKDFGVDRQLAGTDPAEYDALLLPGGVLNPDELRLHPAALRFVEHFCQADKPVGVICHGSQTMISAGLVSNRIMTGYRAIQIDLRNAGASVVTDEPVVVDQNLVSSRNPDDLPDFCAQLVHVCTRYRAPHPTA